MNILFLTQVLPFPMDAGPKTRAYLVLRHLVESGHNVVLVSFVREEDRQESIDHLRHFCSDVHTVLMRRSQIRDATSLLQSLATGTPFLIARDRIPSMVRAIRKAARSFTSLDAIHADQLWMAPYALSALQCVRQKPLPLTVLDQHNAVFNIPLRLAATERNPCRRALLELEAKKLAAYEQKICGAFDRVVWVTEEDRRALGADRAAVTGSHTVIPIALDLSTRPVLNKSKNAHRVTFIGGLNWPPNAGGISWFLKEIWPSVKSRVPDALLTVIGRDSSKMLRNNVCPGVEATGYLRDPSRYLMETAAFIVPLLAGGGMRVKILDAWSWGLPVVSTSIGAEGIRAKHDDNLLLADNPVAFASDVVRIMKDSQLTARLITGGRQTLESHYDWRRIYPAWDEMYPCGNDVSRNSKVKIS